MGEEEVGEAAVTAEGMGEEEEKEEKEEEMGQSNRSRLYRTNSADRVRRTCISLGTQSHL